MSLLETLKAAKVRATAENGAEGRAAVLQEWRGAIDRFNRTIDEWLQPFASNGLLQISVVEAAVKEDPFDSYNVNIVRLKAGNQTIIFQPVARFVTGATGRIDMFRQGRGAIIERYRFLRKGEEEKDFWTIQPPATDKNLLNLMASNLAWNRGALEAALDNLLR